MTFTIRQRNLWLLATVAVAMLTSDAAEAARDGVTGCTAAEVETESGRVWRHTIQVQVPEGGYCRVYIGDDKDRKAWTYCWLKRTADNPVQETCDDPLDDDDFDGWKAKAVCGGQNFIAYCRREKPLIPLPR